MGGSLPSTAHANTLERPATTKPARAREEQGLTGTLHANGAPKE